jgi:hypothetical protein
MWQPDFQSCNREVTEPSAASFREVVFVRSAFNYSKFVGGDFMGADLSGAQFSQTDLTGANLSGAILKRANFEGSTLTRADISGADFFEALASNGEWENLKGVLKARNLDKTSISTTPKYFESCELSWLERWFGWEQLRTLGNLPLFTVSWSVLLFVPTYIYVIAWYNIQADALRSWHSPGNEWFGKHIHDLPMPSLSLFLLIFTVFLAAGATIYAVWCPSRIKEFTLDKWRDELHQSVIHYHAQSWRRRKRRIICVICYAIGAPGVVLIFGIKLCKAGWYIWQRVGWL